MGARFTAWVSSLFMAMVFAIGIMSSPAYAQSTPAPAPAPAPTTSILDWLTPGNGPSFAERRDKAQATLDGKFGCWSCQIFKAFGTGVFQNTDKIDASGKGLIPVMTGFATVFALFYLGSGIVSGDASDLPQRWSVFWRLLFTVAFASFWLNKGAFSFTWSTVFDPLFSLGSGLAKSIVGSLAVADCGAGQDIVLKNGGEAAQAALNQMGQVVCGGHKMSIKGLATGVALMGQRDGPINSVAFMFSGFIVCLMFLWIMISFPLRFIDVIIRLGFVSFVLPLVIVAAVFKPTRSYIQIVISNVLNASLQFALMIIMFAIGFSAFDQIVKQFGLDDSGTGSILWGSGDWSDSIGYAFVMIGMASIFGAMLKTVPAIAAEFSGFRGSGGDSIGNAASGFAAAGAAMPGKVAGAGVGLGAGYMGARSLAGKLGDSVGKSAGGALAKGVTPG